MTAGLSLLWVIVINSLAWFVIHMGISYLSNRLPLSLFESDGWLYRGRKWEAGGDFYRRFLRIRSWKEMLPDGASVFRCGFRKKRIQQATVCYYERFIKETRRSELCHWICLMLSGAFFLWNPWYMAIYMPAYAVLVNMPCVITQRYNRMRFQHHVHRRRQSEADPRPKG